VRSMHTRRTGRLLAGLCTTLLIGGLAFAPPSDANVYKWKDPQGRIHYTDKPPPADGTLISIEPTWYGRRDGQPPPSATAASRSPTPASEEVEPNSPEAQAQLRNAVQNDVSSVRTEQCKVAKERYENYVRSRRLFKEGPNKERVYLSDAELEEARLNAKREMDEACAAAADVR